MKGKTWPALVLIAFAAVAVGCGSGDEAGTSSPSGNAADAAFVTDMSAHHQDAIAMARIAQERAEHPEIRDLAEDIVAAQEGEISVMKTIHRSMHGMVDYSGHMGMSDAEMGMTMDPAELNSAAPFDRAFIDDAQTAEITHMHEWRDEWYGSPGAGRHDAMHGED